MVNTMLKATELAKYARKKGLKASVSVESKDSIDVWAVLVKKAHRLRVAA